MRYTIWSFSDRWRYFQYSEIDTDKFDIQRNVVRQREIKGYLDIQTEINSERFRHKKRKKGRFRHIDREKG